MEFRIVGAGAGPLVVVGADLAHMHVRPVLPPRRDVAPLGQPLRAPCLLQGPPLVLIGRVAPTALRHPERHGIRTLPHAGANVVFIRHRREFVPAAKPLRLLRHAQRHGIAGRIPAGQIHARRPVLIGEKLRRQVSWIRQRHALAVAPISAGF